MRPGPGRRSAGGALPLLSGRACVDRRRPGLPAVRCAVDALGDLADAAPPHWSTPEYSPVNPPVRPAGSPG